MRVLITDGAERATLAAARALVAQGHDVYVASSSPRSLAGASRGVHRLVIASDPLRAPAAYAAEVSHLAERLDLRLILPVTDASAEAILEFRSTLPNSVLVPMPPLGTYRAASDKHGMLTCARAAGLEVPETMVLASRAELRNLPGPSFYPAFVKPHRSVVGDSSGGLRRKLGVTPVQDEASCRSILSALPDAAFPVLLQRRVSGPGEGWFALRWNGRYVAEFAHRRLREKPPDGGVSVYRESIAVPPSLADAGRRLLDRLDWQGVAMIECKRDLATGRHVFMEINGRLWGSLQLAIDAGVDFPGMLVDCALGKPVSSVTTFQVGARSRWFWGDVDHLYLQLKGASASAGPGTAAMRRLRALRAFLSVSFALDREEIWRLRDPGPFVLETAGRLGLIRGTPRVKPRRGSFS